MKPEIDQKNQDQDSEKSPELRKIIARLFETAMLMMEDIYSANNKLMVLVLFWTGFGWHQYFFGNLHSRSSLLRLRNNYSLLSVA